jgi:hypothetical protein
LWRRFACFKLCADFLDSRRLLFEPRREVKKHYCLVRSKVISGQEIQVIGGTRGNGPLRISCPTKHCNAIPTDWVRPANEAISVSALSAREAQRIHPPEEGGLLEQAEQFEDDYDNDNYSDYVENASVHAGD